MKTILPLAVLLTTFFILSSVSYALKIVVTNLDDIGKGSLRDAIDKANMTMGPDEIAFSGGLMGTILILPANGEMRITDDLTITGPGADVITIDAQMIDRIFNIDDSEGGNDIIVSISGLMFINGVASVGGAIENFEELSIDSCVFESNSAVNGGAIANFFEITEITNSTFIGNSANDYGGAIDNQGTISEISNSTFNGNSAVSGGAISNQDVSIITEITNSTFIGNNAAQEGGAINNQGPITEITNSTFNGNSAVNGGAISNQSTISKITNSTFNGNSADGLFPQGGAIQNWDTIRGITNSTFSGNNAEAGGAINNQGTINISFTTIANNNADDLGGGIFLQNPPSSTNIRNSIVAFNTSSSGDNCNQVVGATGNITNNYSNDASCGFDFDNATILLGPLSDNGGSTQTLALLGGNPIDGASALCDPLNFFGMATGVPLQNDQRFFPRPFGPQCDSGAYESGSSEAIGPPSGPERPGGKDGNSSCSSSLAGAGTTRGSLMGLILYALIPAAIVVRRRFRRK